ncbi:MFS transporter [Paenibacillus sinopodophylli]|uniref:MFS transporter n=1 Tax=Paenibacillus sinopodophylli TaxID=1837342 RepID=UPI00110CDA99|nr:MFS transporter [Paenibacillus sinopodophylli]
MKSNRLLIFILAVGVFGILTTEMGVIGILPSIAEQFDVSVPRAGLMVSLFALAVAISGPILPVMFSGINRKAVMLLVLGIFVIGNVISIFASSFSVLLLARVIPAFLHPVYCSLALTVAALSAKPGEAPKAVSRVVLGVTAGMILGVPITNYVASGTSIERAMIFFAIVNLLAFVATLIFVPSMPVKDKLPVGTQVSVLKKPVLWLAIVTVLFINSSIASINSFITEYLGTVTQISDATLTFALFLLGIASLLGNLAGGRFLTKNAAKTALWFPIALGIVLLLSFLTGTSPIPMLITIMLWGIFFAIGNNVAQYWITSAAPEAPDFVNGLYLSFGNLGVTIGTAIGGYLISGMGTKYIVLGGIAFMVLAWFSILLRNYKFSSGSQEG